MEQKFINLRYVGKTVDECAAEFFKLSLFVPYMVSTEENRARDSSKIEFETSAICHLI